ncbi:hypothetical protein BTJ39_01460 [Izhakiella australiensis]|uniref:YfdX family protein n=2 Tax=Izhakiella australiensis TaxID=1926881 RepID=A0A1S8YST7_9GAMM|nr:hypothetical protein BTJ39_01460 [Izhakiella australiensis]
MAVMTNASAAENKTSGNNSSSTAYQSQMKAVDHIAVQGLKAMYDVHYARLALFNGHPKDALKVTYQAKNLLNDDKTDWKKYVHTGKQLPNNGDSYVLINSSISQSENFTITPEKKAAIARANVKLAKGDRKGALDELHLAGIDTTDTQVFMPLKKSRQDVTKAIDLLKQNKYYEANIALKDAEDSVIIQNESTKDQHP